MTYSNSSFVKSPLNNDFFRVSSSLFLLWQNCFQNSFCFLSIPAVLLYFYNFRFYGQQKKSVPEITVFHRRYLQNLKSNTTKSDTLHYVFSNTGTAPLVPHLLLSKKFASFSIKMRASVIVWGLNTQSCFNITPITDFTRTLPQNF